MLTAFVLIHCARGTIDSTAQELVEIDGISEVYSITGSFDLAAVVKVKTPESLSDIVTNKMLKVASIEKTETMVAFRTYSRRDLEEVFTASDAN
ncbi:MAG TPA: Lrp/AsnC ligand binding domain-containing protein [Oligoflexia bacterium]|nr:Lrp/AsnC ligand binding domain-containing protein [Oligoflexia bacterium]